MTIMISVKKLSESNKYILEGLIPYTNANLLLSFKPNLFFNELEKKTGHNKRSLETAYYRLIKKGLVELDDNKLPRLTGKGHRKAKTYKPERLKFGANLMIAFDIPESERKKRRRLRILLQELSFRQVQRSVWETEYDYREYLRAEIAEMDLQEYVRIYEAAQIEI